MKTYSVADLTTTYDCKTPSCTHEVRHPHTYCDQCRALQQLLDRRPRLRRR